MQVIRRRQCYSLPLSFASSVESAVCFSALGVSMPSTAPLALQPPRRLLEAGGRLVVTLLFIGGVLCTNTNRSQVGGLISPLVVLIPFGVLRRLVMWGFWRSLRRQIPRCLSIVCRFVQRLYSMSILMCYSRRCQKNLVLHQGGGRLQAGSSGRQWRE